MSSTVQTASRIADIATEFAEIGLQFSDAAAGGYPALIETAASLIGDALASGNKILTFGNGGSASDAQHICGELVVRFRTNRRALPAISLCSDPAVITACANDFSYEQVFARQIEALGRPGDVAFGITTSGGSPNVINGMKAARERELKTILLTGPSYGDARKYSDVVLGAFGANTGRIQLMHVATYHAICELIDLRFAAYAQ